MVTDKRTRTRHKSDHSDILEVNEGNTIVLKPCHGKTEMCSRVSRSGRVLIVLTLILGLFVHSVFARCDEHNVDQCWRDFAIANDRPRYNFPNLDMTEQAAECMRLRSYKKCLDAIPRCKGNIPYQTVKQVVKESMAKKNCTSDGPLLKPSINSEPLLPPDELCTYRGAKEYKHCGLFGDPHIRTFNNEFQTCSVKGAWPLIQNEHLVVQVTNEPVSFSQGATASTKLTVLIKKNVDCASDKYITYQANSEMLPGTFDGGSVHYGRSHSVKIIEQDPGKLVEIILKYIDTTIRIRLVGGYLTFSISMPAELLNSTSSSALCMKGCPKNEIIDYQRFLALKQKDSHTVSDHSRSVNMTRKEALELCRSANLVDFYLDSCVFDLLTTGNETFKHSAYAALQDVLKLDPNFSKTQQNRTSLSVYDEMFNAGTSVNSFTKNSAYLNLFSVLVYVTVALTLMHLDCEIRRT